VPDPNPYPWLQELQAWFEKAVAGATNTLGNLGQQVSQAVPENPNAILDLLRKVAGGVRGGYEAQPFRVTPDTSQPGWMEALRALTAGGALPTVAPKVRPSPPMLIPSAWSVPPPPIPPPAPPSRSAPSLASVRKPSKSVDAVGRRASSSGISKSAAPKKKAPAKPTYRPGGY